jgi:hypothetical protein
MRGGRNVRSFGSLGSLPVNPVLEKPPPAGELRGRWRRSAELPRRRQPGKRRPRLGAAVATFTRLAEAPAMGHCREDLADTRHRFWTVYSYGIAYRDQTKPLQMAIRSACACGVRPNRGRLTCAFPPGAACSCRISSNTASPSRSSRSACRIVSQRGGRRSAASRIGSGGDHRLAHIKTGKTAIGNVISVCERKCSQLTARLWRIQRA